MKITNQPEENSEKQGSNSAHKIWEETVQKLPKKSAGKRLKIADIQPRKSANEGAQKSAQRNNPELAREHSARKSANGENNPELLPNNTGSPKDQIWSKNP